MNPLIHDEFIAPPCFDEVSILYQDEVLLAVNKPSGLLTLSGKNPANKDSVHYRVVQKFPAARMLHRLDFGTSGVLLLALTKTAAAHINQQFQARSVVKRYHAILAGHLQDDHGFIDLPIAQDPLLFPAMKISAADGKAAKTEYHVVTRMSEPARTLVSFQPHTGRTHQLRIHSAAIGHPILGCDIYGTPGTQALSPRLLLHASSLELNHPSTNERILFESDLPFV